jgi:transaldolase / glucose-6-phosphate isomerase
MNPVLELQQHGQAAWLDFLARGFIAKGDLQKLVEEDGLRGVTSNPSIFEKAIAESDEYDAAMRSMLEARDRAPAELYECLAVEDIKHAADVLWPAYEATAGADGFVSMEVSPYLANETEETMVEARRLWREVDRENLMIKVPATPAGLPAIRALTAEGINVNITLLFARNVYEQVVEAYISGLEMLASTGRDISRVASVASMFVSRIDTLVDKLLDEAIAQADTSDKKKRLSALKGKIAIANAKLAYQHYKSIFATSRWRKLADKGAKPQRLLWASTGTKNKSYSDVLYVQELIGPNTISTMPPATLDAFRDHGRPVDTIETDLEGARRALEELESVGISLGGVTRQLTEEGVRLFEDAADKLLAAIARKRSALLADRLDQQSFAIEHYLQTVLEHTSERWRKEGIVRRFWRHDKTIWTNADEDRWLGWLDSIDRALDDIADYENFAQDMRRDGFKDVLLLGMGGSSLGPEVLGQTFGNQNGAPALHILDSTDPTQIRTAETGLDLARTLFIVSSKSGTTTEPNVLKDYFYARAAQVLDGADIGSHFVAVTDPGSALEKIAQRDGFRRIFQGTPSIGGRYSVLSPFGLVPAAAAGIDVRKLLETARIMVRSCGSDVPPDANPAVQLGLMLGLAKRGGRDKVTLVCSQALADFDAWTEQLMGESTAKHGTGLIPIAGEPLGPPEIYGSDRVFVALEMAGEADAGQRRALESLAHAGHPVVRIGVKSRDHIGQEFFRFELAIAVAGAVIGINPFDQPDVEASKMKTRDLTAEFENTGALPRETPVATEGGIEIYTDRSNASALRNAGASTSVESWLKTHLARLEAGDYFALLAYIARSHAHAEPLQRIRSLVRQRRRVATCLGFGPRFLHSTGQAYKGGPNTGVFLQITAQHARDLTIPGHKASFAIIEAAQARGDFDVLAKRRRRALHVHITGDVEVGLATLADKVERALA